MSILTHCQPQPALGASLHGHQGPVWELNIILVISLLLSWYGQCSYEPEAFRRLEFDCKGWGRFQMLWGCLGMQTADRKEVKDYQRRRAERSGKIFCWFPSQCWPARLEC